MLKPGDKLPLQKELADYLDVNSTLLDSSKAMNLIEMGQNNRVSKLKDKF
nr:hypothetical protein [Clostridium beijerinckii]